MKTDFLKTFWMAGMCMFLLPFFAAASVDMAEVENFTDEINELVRVLEEQGLERTRLENELHTLEVEAEGSEEPLSEGERRENRRGQDLLRAEIRDLNEEILKNEDELNTYGSRIEETHGYAPDLFPDSAISAVSAD